MPVPVPTLPKPPSHTVRKSGPYHIAPLTSALSVGKMADPTPGPGFCDGLAFAPNAPHSASAVNGDHPHARFLPVQPSWDSPNAYSPVYLNGESPDVPSSPLEPVTPLSLYVDHMVVPQLAAVMTSEWAQVDEVTQPAKDVPEVATPSATPEYRKLAEYYSEWIAKFVWKVCTQALALPETFSHAGPCLKQYNPDVPPSYLSGSIHSLLLSTLLEPSAILLAMWYIVRLPVFFASAPLALDRERETLFRMELLGDHAASDRDAMESAAPFRLVVLGFMLSNKWLSDHTYSNKTWHTISNIPVAYLNKLERLALAIYQHDLSITDQNWSNWLDFVMLYHSEMASPVPQPISRPSSNPRVVIRKSIEDIILAVRSRQSVNGLPQPMFMDLEERRLEQLAKENAAKAVYELGLEEDGPVKPEYLPYRRRLNSLTHVAPGVSNEVGGECFSKTFLDSGKPLPPPARWSPAADEPILRDNNRNAGHHYMAPGALAPFPAYTSFPIIYEQARELPLVPNWPGYVAPGKQVAPTGYGIDYVSHLPPAYHFPFVSSLQPHSRSQSLSYGQENHTSSRNQHLRSLSQTQQDTHCSYGRDPWLDACSHGHGLPAPVLAPIYNNAAYTQSSWLSF